MSTKKLARRPVAAGRPRAFDTGEALEHAMRVFWEKGYDGASVADLTTAMQINPPSLYAAFGNKEELFQQVLRHYADGHSSFIMESLNEPTARAVVERRLYGTVDAATRPGQPRGCLAVQAMIRLAGTECPARQSLLSFSSSVSDALRTRLERAKAEGDLPENADPGVLTHYISAVAQGLAVLAASGVSRARLRKVVEVALDAWPAGGDTHPQTGTRRRQG